MKVGAFDHPKIFHLAHLLQTARWKARGLLNTGDVVANSTAITTHHLALCHFCFGGPPGPGLRDTSELLPPDVVEFKDSRIANSALDTPRRGLLLIKPCQKGKVFLAILLRPSEPGWLCRSAVGFLCAGKGEFLLVLWVLSPSPAVFSLTLALFFNIHDGILPCGVRAVKQDSCGSLR